MTQEDKTLLLKDLSGRLPYGVMCDFVYNIGHPQKLLSISLHEKYQIHLDSDEYVFESGKSYGPSETIVDDIKPYLRPMSSMTEEEQRTLDSMCNGVEMVSRLSGLKMFDKAFDWLYSKHLDIHGLIEKGLALEAPEGMYKNK